MMASKTGKLDIFKKCLSNTEMFFRSIFSTLILSVSDTIQHSSLSLSCLDPYNLDDWVWRLQILVETEVTLLTLIMQQFVFGECFIE